MKDEVAVLLGTPPVPDDTMIPSAPHANKDMRSTAIDLQERLEVHPSDILSPVCQFLRPLRSSNAMLKPL